MAIWQFQLYIIPKQALNSRYKAIPDRLNIDNENWDNYFKSGELNSDYKFEDALTISWWKELKITVYELYPIIEKIAPIQQSTEGLLDFGNFDTNNISICFDRESNLIEEVSSRVDLRTNNKLFITDLILLAQKFDCLFMDRKGRLFSPTMTDLVKVIKLSNAYRFTTDPEKFLHDLSDNAIQPE